MITPASRPETTEPKMPHVMKPMKIRNSSAIRISTELPSVPVSRLRSNCFWLAPSLQLTMRMPTSDSSVPKPATIIGESTSFSAMSVVAPAVWAA